MKTNLRNKKVAILVADGFEQVELEKPRAALEKAGAETHVISLHSGTVQGMQHDRAGRKVQVDVTLDRAQPADYDALLLPGGVMNPDLLRRERKAVRFARSFFTARKPVAAICHGPQLLIEADVVRHRRLTSFPSVRTDLKNAGARWVNRQVVVDGDLVTSRKPDDIPAFNRQMVRLFARGATRRRGPRA